MSEINKTCRGSLNAMNAEAGVSVGRDGVSVGGMASIYNVEASREFEAFGREVEISGEAHIGSVGGSGSFHSNEDSIGGRVAGAIKGFGLGFGIDISR